MTLTLAGAGLATDNQRYEHVSRLLLRSTTYSVASANSAWCWPICDAPATMAARSTRASSGAGPTTVSRNIHWSSGTAPRPHAASDVELLAEMNRAHEHVCGPANAYLLQYAHTVSGDPRYERLADLSLSHKYNPRKRADYQARRVIFVETSEVGHPIGLRKAASPNGRADFVRINTVHQGNLGDVKSVH